MTFEALEVKRGCKAVKNKLTGGLRFENICPVGQRPLGL